MDAVLLSARIKTKLRESIPFETVVTQIKIIDIHRTGNRDCATYVVAQ